MAENTFLGLQPYTEDDAYRFKGRTEESQELFRLIVRNDFTVCYAESGEGKTSLLNAGVFPLLRENMYFPIAITFTSDDYQVTPDNFSTIIDRCIKDSITEYNEKNKGINVEYRLCSTDFQGLDCQAELQQELSKYSWWKLRNYKPQAMGLTFTPVFVFDQFEEVFNMPGSIVWTKKFFDWLEDLSSDSCPDKIAKKIRAIIGTNAAFPNIKEEKDFKAVFSLRKEFIGELDYWGMQKCFIPSLKDNRYCIKPLTINNAKEILGQGDFDAQTEFDVIKHLAGNEYSDTEQDVPCISALLLSIVCTSLSDKSDVIKQSIEVLNNPNNLVNHIISLFYQQSIENLQKERIVENGEKYYEEVSIPKKHLKTIERALIDDNGKRLRISVTTNELKKIDFIENYLDPLKKGRLIRINHFEGQNYVELIHDQLAKVISERVKKRTSRRIHFFCVSALFVFLLITTCLTLQPMAKNMGFVKHNFPSLKCDYEIINNNYVEELHLQSYKHTIESLKPLKRLFIENKNKENIFYQVQVSIEDCPVLDEIHIENPITELILDLKDSINAVVFINPDLRRIVINNSNQSKLAFVISDENKNFIWKDNVLWHSKTEKIVYIDPTGKKEIAFPDDFKNNQFIYYMGEMYSNKNFLPYLDEYSYHCEVITSENASKHPAKRIIITDSVKSIDMEAFKYQDSLLEVVFDPNCQINRIGARAFAYCKNIKKVVVPTKLDLRGYEWWDNPFLECHNITFELTPNDSSNLVLDENGVVWRLGIITGKDTINEPIFYKNSEKSPSDLFDNESEKRIVRFQSNKNGFIDLLNLRVLLRTDLAELDITDYISPKYKYTSNRIYHFFNTKNLEKIHVGRVFPDYKLNFSDSDKSCLTLVVPKGCKTLYENDDNFKGFRRIEEDNRFWPPYYYSIKEGWQSTRIFISIYWKTMLPVLLVILILFSTLIDFIIRFNNRRKGKEHLAIISRIYLILSYILLGFFSYTVFYWFFLESFPWKINNPVIWCNVIAIIIAIIISLLLLYLRNVSGDWALFKAEWRSSRKKTKEKIARFYGQTIRLIRKQWRAGTCIILAIISFYGICQGINTIKSHEDLDRMIDAKNWKRVSLIVYNKIMDADSIDNIDRSWTRTMLLAANQDTISNGYQVAPYNSWVSSSSYMVYKTGSKTYVLDLKNRNRKPIEITGISHYLDGIFNDRYLLTNSPLCYYDLASHHILVNKKTNGGIYDCRYFNSGIKSWCDENSYWRKKHDSEASTVYIFNGNTLTIDSIPFPMGYVIDRWSIGRYLRFYTLNTNSQNKGIYYDINSKEFIPEPNNTVLFNSNFICKKNNDTLIISTNQDGEIRDNIITNARSNDIIGVVSNCLIYKDTMDNLQCLSFRSGATTTIGKGKTLFYYGSDNSNDSIFIISQFDTIRTYQLNEETPIKLAEIVIKNRIQHYGEGGKSLYNCMKKGIIANKINNTVQIYHLLYGKKLKSFNKSFDFNSINEHFIIKYEEYTKIIELYPLDGSSTKTPIIIRTQNILNKHEVNTTNDCIVRTNNEFFILPTLEQTINNNVYLNENQKANLIDKLKLKRK